VRLLPALAVLCLAACGNNVRQETTTATTTTTAPQPAPAITGTVYLAPNCPPGPCPPRPAPAADVDVRDGTTRDGGATVATAKTGPDGRYSITVAPGRYVVTARLPKTNCGTVPVTVPPPATADITCAPIGSP